ncbi:hypothetical protein [Natrinema versiforme]|nr:hypothetical protein [Natrinema versiforme]
MIMMLMMVAVAGAAVPSMAQDDTTDSDVSDITVEVSDNGTAYEGTVELYDASDDSMVDTNTVESDGTITFQGHASGDYYLSTDGDAPTESKNFTHEDGATQVNWDISDNTLTVEEPTYILEASATLDNETVTADFTLDDGNKSGESVQYDVEDGEYTISAEYVEENEDGENVTYTASKTVDMNGSDQSVELTLEEEDEGVVGNTVDTAGSTWTDLVTEYGVVVAGIIVVVLVLIIVYGLMAIGSAARDDPQP